MDILQNILAFIFAIGILVTIHEFGHYWVAKKLGIKILRFSVGFGKPIWMKRFGADQTEFTVSSIPLGGYVKMLDEREAKVAPAEQHRAFNRQPVLHRIAVVIAGPLFNFLFAIAAYWLMFILGVSGPKPLIESVIPESVAYEAGIEPGDRISAVDGQLTPTWAAFLEVCINHIVDGKSLKLDIADQNDRVRQVIVAMDHIHINDLSEGNLLTELGIEPKRIALPAVIDQVLPGGAAEAGGIRTGDKILSANDQQVTSWGDWVQLVRQNPSQSLKVSVQRGTETVQLVVTPERKVVGDQEIGQIGAGVQQITIPEDMIGVERYGFASGFLKGVEKTWDMSALTLKLMGKMITGEASVKNLSGPISIAQYAGQSASVGLTAFLSFLAIVSVSLGVLNLLPIPILDGGHLLYYLIELIKGSPLSENVQLAGQNIGMLLLVAMMSVAFYNDIMRLFS